MFKFVFYSSIPYGNIEILFMTNKIWHKIYIQS